MRGKKSSIGLTLAIFMVALLVAGTLAVAQEEKVLHSFGGGTDGNEPYAGLIFDASGSLYGTTAYGGGGTDCDGNCGTVFELIPKAGGGWMEEVLHTFDGADGASPTGGLVFDDSGNLYGTTGAGGAYGDGTVFRLARGAGGKWAETVLHEFCPTGICRDGAIPWAGLTLDASGNLYGTAIAGGGGCYEGCGVVFELTRKADGGWEQKVIHAFNGTDGAGPYAGVTLDASGNLYGTTLYGGSGPCFNGGPPLPPGCGTVFELTRRADGSWKQKVLRSFTEDADGLYPYAGVILDASGNLYGTTAEGSDGGTVFELTPRARGAWKEKVLHNFSDSGTDGTDPTASLIFDAAGNLYGTTNSGGAYGIYGTVFEMSPKAGGGWTEKVLHSFNNNGTDGYRPGAGLILDTAGNLYGTTTSGGAYGDGTVFEITP